MKSGLFHSLGRPSRSDLVHSFVKMYEKDNMNVAISCYKEYLTIFRKTSDFDLIQEIEEFIIWVIESESNKTQLYWLTAMLANERGDFYLSQKYLDEYLRTRDVSSNGKFKECVDILRKCNKAKKCLVE